MITSYIEILTCSYYVVDISTTEGDSQLYTLSTESGIKSTEEEMSASVSTKRGPVTFNL